MFFDNVKVFVYRNEFVRTILYPVRMVRLFLRGIPEKWQMNVVSNLSDLLVDDVVVRVDEFGGVFSMSGRSDLFQRLILYKSYEPELVDILKRLVEPQKDVVDVGANIGFYTIMLANLIDDNRRVLAIEPTSKSLQRLRNNLLLNRMEKKVIVFDGGVSNVPGFLNMKIILDKEEYSTLGLMVHPSVSTKKFTTEQVQISTIDILVDKYSLTPGLIKIDVEGMEPLVIRGMQNVLQKHRPIVLMEWDEFMLKSNGFVPSEVINLLKKYEYKMLDPLAPSFPPKGNMLCLPVERVNDFLAHF
jgi:FkbM family methyltransferase